MNQLLGSASHPAVLPHPRVKLRMWLLLLAALGCAVSPRPTAAQDSATTPISAAQAVATFDSAWSRIGSTHYDPAMNGVDWDAVRAELRPRAEAAQTPDELRAVIEEMFGRLGDSHYALIPAEVADALDPETPADEAGTQPGDAGLELRLVGDELLVSRVEAGSAAEAAGVRPGWSVIEIDHRPLAPRIAALDELAPGAERRAALVQLLAGANVAVTGPAGSTVPVRFRDATGETIQRDLTLHPTAGVPIRFGNLPTIMSRLEHQRLEREGGCVGVIRFNIWMPALAQPFARALDELRDCQGIVIDLRGNPGGVGAMVMGIGGHFLSEPTALGSLRTRENTLRFTTNPQRVDAAGKRTEPYAGPLAILVDPLSISTSEVFAAGMQTVGRARVFGENSAGQALPAYMVRLPTGDVLMHVFADFVGPGGARIEGEGVVPDEPVPLTRAGLLAGRDEPLEAALRWIVEQP